MGFSDWLWGTNSGSGGGGGDTSGSALDWAKFLAAMYQSQKKPSYSNVPQSPQQKELYDYSVGRMKALPDVIGALAPTAISRSMTSPSFDVAAAKRGDTAYSHGTGPDPADLARVLGGGPQQPTTPAAPPANASPNPATNGSIGGGPGAPTFNANLYPPGIHSTQDWNTVSQFMQTYGRAAGEGVLALLTQNPGMAVKAAIDAYRAYSSHQATTLPPSNTHPGSSEPYPSDILRPGTRPGEYGGNPNPGNAQWITPGTPGSGISEEPWYVQWLRDHPRDPMGGAGITGSMLGAQDSMGWGSRGRTQAY